MKRAQPANADQHDRYMTHSRTAASLTRLELAMNRAMEGLIRWSVEGHKRLTRAGLNFSDLLLLHSVRMRGSPASLMDLLTFLNRHDLSNVQYSLKKLERAGLIEKSPDRSNRETRHVCTASGIAVTDRYAQIRRACLIDRIDEIAGYDDTVAAAASTIERLVGLYEQAAQTQSNDWILGAEQPSAR